MIGMTTRSEIMIIIIAILLGSASLFSESHIPSPSAELAEGIMRSQEVDRPSEIDLELVPPETLELLGREVMEEMLGGNAEWHRRMNSLLGGEDSAHLKELHVSLGKLYCRRDGEIESWRHEIMAPGMLSDRIPASPFSGGVCSVLIIVSVVLIIRVVRRLR